MKSVQLEKNCKKWDTQPATISEQVDAQPTTISEQVDAQLTARPNHQVGIATITQISDHRVDHSCKLKPAVYSDLIASSPGVAVRFSQERRKVAVLLALLVVEDPRQRQRLLADAHGVLGAFVERFDIESYFDFPAK